MESPRESIAGILFPVAVVLLGVGHLAASGQLAEMMLGVGEAARVGMQVIATVLDDQGVVLLAEHEAGALKNALILFVVRLPDSVLLLADGIIEVVLQHHVLERVVANEPWPQLPLVNINEPVDEGAIDPGGGLAGEEVGWASAQIVGDHRLLLVGMHDLLIQAVRDLRVVPVATFAVRGFLGRHEDLLHGVHEGSKDQSREHDKHERRRHDQVIVLLTVAVGAWLLWILAIPLDLEDESKGDGAANHACIHDEQELVKLDRLLLEAAAARIEGANNANDSTSEDNGELEEDEGPAPPGGNRGVECKADVGVDSGFGHLAKEAERQRAGLLALR